MASSPVNEALAGVAGAYAGDVGARLKYVREKAGLSQRELARRADVTNGTLSNIEQGKASPTVSSLEKILSAVPISIVDFFATDLGESPLIFRKSDFVEVQKNGAHHCILPVDNPVGREVSLARQTYAPGAGVNSDWMIHDGTIAGMVISGVLTLSIDSELYSLSAGEGFNFSSRRTHVFSNLSDQPCVVVSVSIR